jgi:capsular polysaccharide biosynthesis protein
MTTAPGPGLRTIDIAAIGQRVPLAMLGSADGPAIAYAIAEDIPPLRLPAPVFLNRTESSEVFPEGVVSRHATVACAVRNCFLFGPFGLVVLPDGTLIRQSALQVTPGALAFTFAQFKGQFPGTHVMWAAADETVVSYNGYSTNNFFHFLIDTLGGLHWRDRLPAMSSARIILSGYSEAAASVLPFIGESIAAAGLSSDLYPFDGTIMFCRRLVFPMRDTGATPAKAATLRRLFKPPPPTGERKRLYITRPSSTRRRVANDAAVARLLAGYGFQVCDPGRLSFAQQIEVFAQAEIVVGPHGAGLANAIFMPPGGALIELTHAGRVVWTFHEVAAAAGLAYGCVIGEMEPGADNPFFADFSVDCDAVDAALRAALAAVGA